MKYVKLFIGKGFFLLDTFFVTKNKIRHLSLTKICKIIIKVKNLIPYKHTTCIPRWNDVLTRDIRGVFLGFFKLHEFEMCKSFKNVESNEIAIVKMENKIAFFFDHYSVLLWTVTLNAFFIDLPNISGKLCYMHKIKGKI